MVVTTSYEVYQKRADDWAILFVHADREEALGQARNYIQQKPSSVVQVIEERLDGDSNQTQSTIIFHGGLAKPTQEPAELHAYKRRRRPPPPKKPHPVSAFVRSAIIIVLSLFGITTAALIGMAMVVDFIH